jgi:hypothetical protein
MTEPPLDRPGEATSLCGAAIEYFRQPCEIDCQLSRLVYCQEAGVSCNVWVGSAVEHPKLLPVASSTANPLGISTIRHGTGKRLVMDTSALLPVAFAVSVCSNNPCSGGPL